jgi:hypothetical protein
LRLVIAATILATGAASALIIIRDLPQSHIVVSGSSTIPAAPIPTSAFVASLVLWLVAWSLALTGAIFGHRGLGLLVVIIFIFVSLVGLIIERTVLLVAVPLLFIALWILALSLARWLVRLRGSSLPRWLPLVSFVVTLVALASHYAILWYFDKQGGPGTAILPKFVDSEFEGYAFVLVPVLFLTGSDFAEWAEIAGGQLTDWLKRARSAWVLLTASALVAVGILIWRLLQRETFPFFDLAWVLDLAAVAVFGLLTALIYFIVARLGHLAVWPRVALPVWALILATVTFLLLQAGPTYVGYIGESIVPLSPEDSVDYSVFHHQAQTFSPAFSLIYPSGWKKVVSEPQKSAAEGLVVVFLGTAEPGLHQFLVVEVPTSVLNGVDQYSIEQAVVTGACRNPKCSADLIQAPSHGSWFTQQTTVQDQDTHGHPVQLKGMAWERTQGDSTWVLYGAVESDQFKATLPIYTAMLDSWKPNLGAVVPRSPVDRLVDFLINLDPTGILSFALLPLAVAILIGMPLLLRGRRRQGPLAVAGLFLTAFGLGEGLLFLPQILAYFGVPTSQVVLLTLNNDQVRLSNIPTLNLQVLQITAALFTLLLVGWLIVRKNVNSRAGRDLLAIALLLNTGLLGIELLDVIFTATDEIALRLTAAQGVLLILAFLWDLLTSGKQITNTEGRNSPRSARVLLYAGFSLLSCSQVLFFATLGGSAGQNVGGDWTDTGLTALGIPVLLTIIMMRFARVGQQPTPPQVPVDVPVGEVGQTLPDSHLPGIYDSH